MQCNKIGLCIIKARSKRHIHINKVPTLSKDCKLEVYLPAQASTIIAQPTKDQCHPSSTSITIANASNIESQAPWPEPESHKEPESESLSHQSSKGHAMKIIELRGGSATSKGEKENVLKI